MACHRLIQKLRKWHVMGMPIVNYFHSFNLLFGMTLCRAQDFHATDVWPTFLLHADINVKDSYC